MQKLKVLIVDDSAVYRTQISAALEDVDWLETIGTAANGRIALERIEQFKPDFVILDLEMPELDGIGTLRELKQRRLRCKTLVFSSLSKKGSEITLQALSLGATDFVAKPDSNSSHSDTPAERIRALLLPKLEALRPSTVIHVDSRRSSATTKRSGVIWDIFKPRVVVIGSSTGGPTVLEKIAGLLKPPSADPLFESAAAVYGERCLAIVLTGMGADGRTGAQVVKNHRGAVMIQSEDSCVVFGMPGAVFATGNYDLIGDPEQIALWMNEKISLQFPNFSTHGGRRV